MDFEKRLNQAIQRGLQASNAEGQARVEQALGVEDLRRMHSEFRLELSEHIDECFRQLARMLRGFESRQVMGDDGWGVEIQRDDLGPQNAGGTSRPHYSRYFTRLQIAVKPFSTANIVEIIGKATVRNKELFSRSQFQRLPNIDSAVFKQTIDQWILEFAEKYTASS